MFESGWGLQEIILIAIIALVVVGPERLPDLARKAGLWFGKLRRFVSGVKADIEKEVAADELKKVVQDQIDASGVHEIIEETKETMHDAKQEYMLNAITEGVDLNKDANLNNESNVDSSENSVDAIAQDKNEANQPVTNVTNQNSESSPESPADRAEDKSEASVSESNKQHTNPSK